MVIALVGNPNCGKSVIFNALTGARQPVGNWPGVTVEHVSARARVDSIDVTVVDLPGTYSLAPGPPDETVTRQFILDSRAEAIINVVDATNLERNLYLTLQLIQTRVPMVVALNMMDEAADSGLDIDVEGLSKALGVPVVPTVGVTGKGLDALLNAAVDARQTMSVAATRQPAAAPPPSWDEADPSGEVAARLYDAAASIVSSVVRRRHAATGVAAGANDRNADAAGPDNGDGPLSRTLSQRIDAIALSPVLAFPLFLAVIAAMFGLTFTIGGPLSDLAARAMGVLHGVIEAGLEAARTPELIRAFVLDGVLAGVGAVLEFAPPVFALFLSISLLEDTGYMARAALISDRIMTALGLSGRAMIPMILGFGCNVSGILATRTLDNRRERLVSILINPFISCSARLPVYVLFATALFPKHRWLVVFSLYVLGVAIAAAAAKALSLWLLARERRAGVSSEADSASAFVMELPPYRKPSGVTVLKNTWRRGQDFLSKAGSVIAMGVVAMWVLTNLPPGSDGGPGSLMGMIGSVIAPVFRPAGFGTWQASSALVFGVFAKEMIAGSLGVLYGAGETGLAAALSAHFTPAAGYAFLVMSMAYVPCVATMAAIRRETGSRGWTVFAVVYQMVIAWGLSVATYQVLRLVW
jgi:ferrous iron transport protein B